MGSRHRPTTRHRHPLPEVVSALQKSVRRGLLDDSLHWAVELDLSGYGEYLWRRLRIIASEDVGPANPNLPATVQALYASWQDMKGRPNHPERLFLVHAVILLARSPKSRLVDHALMVHYVAHDDLRRPIPDFALDQHTHRGRVRGRGPEHFFEEGARLENDAGIPDQYRPFALWLAQEGRKPPIQSPPPARPERGQMSLGDAT